MYTKDDVIQYLADERLRSIYFCNQLLEKLDREMKSNPPLGTLTAIARAKSIVNGLFFTLLGTTHLKAKEGSLKEQLIPLVEKDYFEKVISTPRITLDSTVYPSNEKTLSVVEDSYGGAHCYCVKESLGFVDGKPQYGSVEQILQFVHKTEDGMVTPGIQSEQVVQVLLDRHEKLNAADPSAQYAKMKRALTAFLTACKERIDDRIERNVMGELKQ